MQCIIDFEVDDLLWVAASKKPERCVVYYNWNGHRNSLEAGKIEDEDECVMQLMSSVLQIINPTLVSLAIYMFVMEMFQSSIEQCVMGRQPKRFKLMFLLRAVAWERWDDL